MLAPVAAVRDRQSMSKTSRSSNVAAGGVRNVIAGAMQSLLEQGDGNFNRAGEDMEDEDEDDMPNVNNDDNKDSRKTSVNFVPARRISGVAKGKAKASLPAAEKKADEVAPINARFSRL